jgi:hypothetical protein
VKNCGNKNIEKFEDTKAIIKSARNYNGETNKTKRQTMAKKINIREYRRDQQEWTI